MSKLSKQLNKLVFATTIGLVAGCSNTKFVPNGDYLYTGASINIIGDSLTKSEKSKLKTTFKEQLTPKPNKSFLGLRPKLYIYNITGKPKKEKGLKHWLKNKVGEKPVYLSSVDIPFNLDLIENTGENLGYFNISASFDTIKKNKKATINYTVSPRTQYVIEKVSFPTDSTLIGQEIAKIADRSLLKVNQPFNLNVIKAERERIDAGLKERGFYYFDPDNIIVQVDSTVTKHKVDLNVKVKDNTPEIAKDQYTIDKIYIFSDFNLRRNQREQRMRSVTSNDTLLWRDNIYVIDPKKKFRPQIYDRALYFKSGDFYNRTNHNLTLNRLINLGTFKFVKNQFVVSDSSAHKFDAYYYLTPNDFKSLRFEVLGKSNSASYAGGEANFNWRHKNFLKGAELFTASLYTALDFQVGGNKEANNIYRIGSKFSLMWPRIIAPFNFHSSSAFVPKTRVEVGYEYQKRTKQYSLHNFNGSFGYLWKENALREHDLKIIDITYVTPDWVSEEYQKDMNDSSNKNADALRRVVEKQLIFGPVYSYTYTTTMLPKEHTFYYRGLLDLSANLTGLIMGAKADDQKSILGVPFSQYAKMEHDFRYYLKLNDKSQLAARFIGGLAYPYGNSEYMPFSKQFFVGGSNSIRAFRARTLGPGSYDPRNDRSKYFHDQAGDVKLEANLEYRANIVSFLNAAVFVDAGNVWLLNDQEGKPGGKLSKEWLSEIAVGAGVGLRFDFSILILRTDFAFPLRVPYYPKGDRWNFNEIDFRDKQWRKDNLMLNIAIGYPF
ncbi:BamA/TamA family outer membrane protein [Flavobacterium sp. xlx-214]|uniref:translocation and assembly module lipoprotein TamL n=1 Tax=unclassified Flavobacterium TaxID=196869 RepID=UPI0013D4A6D5|nr:MULTISPECIES: BamA/TamA family outer membrane protein [unclassified Flavobacterium]MBA5794080.1 BamA/TamA family outer membrane protein [Flavobacterium sp. xlx-221]QMI83704.1 BamA/TamA family outer membrane protein [Flavobacterium sp. xlx-214]